MAQSIKHLAEFVSQSSQADTQASQGAFSNIQPVEGISGRLSQASSINSTSANAVKFSNITLKPDHAAEFLSEKAPAVMKNLHALDKLLASAGKSVVADASLKITSIKGIESNDVFIKEMKSILHSLGKNSPFTASMKQGIKQAEASKRLYEINPAAAEAESQATIAEVEGLNITSETRFHEIRY